MEPIRPVHSLWVEITKEDNIQWEPDKHDDYWGSRGGAPAGPSDAALLVARTTKSLLSLFLFMVSLTFFSQVAKWTHKYCYEDWVVESFGKDRDGDAKRIRHFEDVPAQIERGFPYPGRRHRADKEKKKYTITTGFVLCWMGMLILQGSHFGANKRSAAKMWRGQPYGISIPYIQNTMTR